MSASKKNLMHCLIMFALTLGIGMLPPFGGAITPFGMKIIGVFVGVLYGWTFLGFFWTSMYGMLGLCLSGYGTIWKVLGEGFSNTVALQVICLFLLVAYLLESGFVETVLGFFMTRKIVQGRPFVLMFTMFMACGIVLMFGLGFGGVFFCWALMYRIFDLLGYKKGDWVVTFMLFGVGSAAGLCHNVFPFAIFPTMASGFLATVGVTINEIPWILWNFAYTILYYVAYVLVGKYVLRLNVQPFIDRAEELTAMYAGQKTTKQQQIAGIMTAIFLVVTLLPSLLPAGALKAFLGQFGMAGGVIVVIILTSLIYIDDKPLANWAQLAQKGIHWDLVIMFVATTPIANALESADAGVLTTVMNIAMPILSDASGTMFIIVVSLAFLVFTQFAHNLVLVIAFTPMILNLAAEMGNVNLLLLMNCIIVCANAAFLTPGASSPSAAVFSNTAWMDIKQTYILAAIIIVLAVLCLIIMAPIGNVVL